MKHVRWIITNYPHALMFLWLAWQLFFDEKFFYLNQRNLLEDYVDSRRLTCMSSFLPCFLLFLLLLFFFCKDAKTIRTSPLLFIIRLTERTETCDCECSSLLPGPNQCWCHYIRESGHDSSNARVHDPFILGYPLYLPCTCILNVVYVYGMCTVGSDGAIPGSRSWHFNHFVWKDWCGYISQSGTSVGTSSAII
jgi:hypothetical protein